MSKKQVCLFLGEVELTHILKHLRNDDVILRPYLQVAGENIFNWNKNNR